MHSGRRRTGLVAGALAAFLIAPMLTGTAFGALAGPSPGAHPGPLAAHPAWQFQTSPGATAPGGQIQSVSCSATGACTAVGDYLGPSGITVTLAQRWNGKTWSQQSTPIPAGDTVPASSPALLGVSCPAAGFCEAVGEYSVGVTGISLAQSWNGHGWTAQPFPAPASSTSAVLTQVSCTSAAFCEAVGEYRNGAGENLPFAASWNGASWHLQSAPAPAASTTARFGAVSCVSPKFCEAGGNSDAGSFAARWNGTSWRLQTVPGTAGVGAISCVSPAFCESVGNGGGDEWNGSSWSAQAIPSPAGATSAILTGVSCPAAAFCEAVGHYNDSSGDTFGFAAKWKGISWAAQPVPVPAGSVFTSLSGVSCPAPAHCEAGGQFQLNTSASIALAVSGNGSSWRVQAAVTPAGAVNNTLSAVSCPSAAFCEAVGSHVDSTRTDTVGLAQVWNGVSWKLQGTPDPALAASGFKLSLDGVSCVSPIFCEAVGASSNPGGGGAEIWRGTGWALQAVPAGNLVSVSCTSVLFCLAAGQDGHVDQWSGSQWSEHASAAGFTFLTSVSCPTSTSCEATGSGPAGDLAERWNGVTWTPQATPLPAGGSDAELTAVSCSGTKFCEAVGNYLNSSFQTVTLTEIWNGIAWTTQSSPEPAGAQDSSLSGLWCASAKFCAAVGQFSFFGPSRTLAEVWNGSTWALRSAPSHPYAGENQLSGVACTSKACTAVGVTDDPGQVEATLIETGN